MLLVRQQEAWRACLKLLGSQNGGFTFQQCRALASETSMLGCRQLVPSRPRRGRHLRVVMRILHKRRHECVLTADQPRCRAGARSRQNVHSWGLPTAVTLSTGLTAIWRHASRAAATKQNRWDEVVNRIAVSSSPHFLNSVWQTSGSTRKRCIAFIDNSPRHLTSPRPIMPGSMDPHYCMGKFANYDSPNSRCVVPEKSYSDQGRHVHGTHPAMQPTESSFLPSCGGIIGLVFGDDLAPTGGMSSCERAGYVCEFHQPRVSHSFRR